MNPHLIGDDREGRTLFRERDGMGGWFQLLVSNIHIEFRFVTVSGNLEPAQVSIPGLPTCGAQNYNPDFNFEGKKKPGNQTNRQTNKQNTAKWGNVDSKPSVCLWTLCQTSSKSLPNSQCL